MKRLHRAVAVSVAVKVATLHRHLMGIAPAFCLLVGLASSRALPP